MASERLRRGARVLGTALVLALAGCYDGDPSDFRETVVASRDKVTALSVSTPASIIEVGTHLQLTATATTAAGTQDVTRDVSWHSSAPGIVAIDGNGRITGLADGSATLTADLAVYSASVAVTSSSAALQTIAVAGPASLDECTDTTYTASGHYDDGTDRDITSLVTWAVGDAAIARMSTLSGDRNRLLARDSGATTLTASRNGIDSPPYAVTVLDTLTAIAVTPATPAEFPVGDTRSFTATGTWGATSATISRHATWTVANDDTSASRIASVKNGDNNPGDVTAENGGTGTLTATCGGLASTVPITVTYLKTLAITNTAPITLKPNSSLLLVLEGTYSDGSVKSLNEQATWSAALVTGTVVSVSNSTGTRGKVTSTGTGVSTVTATVDGKSISVTVSVAN